MVHSQHQRSLLLSDQTHSLSTSEPLRTTGSMSCAGATWLTIETHVTDFPSAEGRGGNSNTILLVGLPLSLCLLVVLLILHIPTI